MPAHPASEDYLARFSRWQMLGNDQYGDCVAVTWANIRRLVTAALTGTEQYPDMAQVTALYRTQNPAFPTDDNGMEIQTTLEHLVHDGGPDGTKAVAFAKLDHHDLDEVKAALAVFGYVWTGVMVREANLTAFDYHSPWDHDPASPIVGGHSVISGGYAGLAEDDVRFITWAAETAFTDDFWLNDVEEAWAVIWPEHLGNIAFLEGVNLAALAADYRALTGRELPTPIPPPAPEPVPAAPPSGCLDVADRALVAATAVWLAARHSGANRVAAAAVKVWASAKGLL